MYVGGILSHIIIGAVVGHPDAQTAYNVYTYKELSAYILILPGMGLKVFADVYLYKTYDIKPNWLKIKLAMMAFLSINAFVFLVPMMPELRQLAFLSIQDGQLSDEFFIKFATEEIVGISNSLPLLIEILMGSFRPKLFKERATA
jgi:hypothetical protein